MTSHVAITSSQVKKHLSVECFKLLQFSLSNDPNFVWCANVSTDYIYTHNHFPSPHTDWVSLRLHPRGQGYWRDMSLLSQEHVQKLQEKGDYLSSRWLYVDDHLPLSGSQLMKESPVRSSLNGRLTTIPMLKNWGWQLICKLTASVCLSLSYSY